MLSSAYRLLTFLGGPVIALYLQRRKARGREDPSRFSERLGIPSQARSPGLLVWCHAASMGEASSLLALIEKMRALYPATQILITTGTVTSARMLADRLPEGVTHQFVPVDRMAYVRRFLDHWRPDLAIWVESELWPNTLSALRTRGVPTVLLNGTMSDQSFRNWYRLKGWAKLILSAFTICLVQTVEDQSRFVALGAKPVRCVGNLKYAALPLPFDAAELEGLRAAIGERPVWLLASSHEGEEAEAFEAHRSLTGQRPDILTIIVPRHPERAGAIEELAKGLKLTVARRSRGDRLTSATAVYLADTMGELGLFYRLSRIMCMGGSFVPVGGHNLVEPAQLGCAIIFGPYMNSKIAPAFSAGQAALQLRHANEIPFTVNRLLAAPAERDRLAAAAQRVAGDQRHVLERILEVLEPWLLAKGPVSEKEVA